MTIAYIDGDFVPLEEATISVMDRGFIFGDGVYEVIPVYSGRLFRAKEHIHRLEKSLKAIYLEEVDLKIFPAIFDQLLELNQLLPEQAIYLQVTRGKSLIRDHRIPKASSPTIFAYVMTMPARNKPKTQNGAHAVTIADIRWQRCDIKSTDLLPNILAQRQAEEAGAIEAIFVKNDLALEGTSSNLFIVKAQTVITPPLSQFVLGGITRELILELAIQNKIPQVEQNITVNELKTADEIWIASSTWEVLPITILNHNKVSTGKIGPVWRQINDHYQTYKQNLIHSNTL